MLTPKIFNKQVLFIILPNSLLDTKKFGKSREPGSSSSAREYTYQKTMAPQTRLVQSSKQFKQSRVVGAFLACPPEPK